MYENSVTYQFVANVASGLADNAANAGTLNAVDLPEGAVAIVDENGNNVATNAAVGENTPIKIVQRLEGQLKQSPVFTRNQLFHQANLAYVAPANQVSIVGSDGTTGQLDSDGGCTYTLSIVLDHTQGVYNNTPMIKTVPFYLAPDTVATDEEMQRRLAFGLIASLERQFARERDTLIIPDVVAEVAGADVDAFEFAGAATITVTNGSPIAVYNADNTNAGKPDVGDYVTFDGVTVYQVTGVDGDASFTLDRNYTGATETDAFAADGGTFDPADAAAWGIRLTGTGVNPASYDPNLGPPTRVRFQLSFNKIVPRPNILGLSDVPVTTLSTPTQANDGLGTYPLVAYQEVWTSMNHGNSTVSHYPPTKYINGADRTNVYHQIILSGRHTGYQVAATGQVPVSLFNMVIPIATGLNATTRASIVRILGL